MPAQERIIKMMLKYIPQNEIAVNPVSELATPMPLRLHEAHHNKMQFFP